MTKDELHDQLSRALQLLERVRDIAEEEAHGYLIGSATYEEIVEFLEEVE